MLTRTVAGAIDGDEVELTGGTAAFADAAAGADKTVTLTGASLTGADAGNYSLTGVGTAQASIEPLGITGAFTAADKVYDGGTAAEVLSRSLVGVLDSGDVGSAGGSAAFADRNAGTDKTVMLTGASLAGADAGNYSLTVSRPRRRRSSRSGSLGRSRLRTRSTTAAPPQRSCHGRWSACSTAATSRLAGGTAAFADQKAGTDKTVTLTGASLAGADAGNYSLTGVATAQASIEPLGITGAFTAADKVYDGGTAAEVLSRSLVGVLDSGDVELAGGTAAFADRNAGTDKTVTLTGASLTGADAGNYRSPVSRRRRRRSNRSGSLGRSRLRTRSTTAARRQRWSRGPSSACSTATTSS